MGIEIQTRVQDLETVMAEQAEEIINLRVKLASAIRTIRELDLATPEGATKLIGVATYEKEDSDETRLPDVQNQS